MTKKIKEKSYAEMLFDVSSGSNVAIDELHSRSNVVKQRASSVFSSVRANKIEGYFSIRNTEKHEKIKPQKVKNAAK